MYTVRRRGVNIDIYFALYGTTKRVIRNELHYEAVFLGQRELFLRCKPVVKPLKALIDGDGG
jgi:hypothetical protein